MRQHNCLAIVLLLLGGLAAAPVSGEQLEYYVWTDEYGVIHAEDTPPEDGDYETRIIDLEENVIPSPDLASSDGRNAMSPGSESADSGPDAEDADPETDDSTPLIAPDNPAAIIIPAISGP